MTIVPSAFTEVRDVTNNEAHGAMNKEHHVMRAGESVSAQCLKGEA